MRNVRWSAASPRATPHPTHLTSATKQTLRTDTMKLELSYWQCRQSHGLLQPRVRPFTGVNCRAVLSDPSQRPNASLQQMSNIVRVPQTDAKVQFAEPSQLYLGNRALLGGRQVEEDAVRQCVELHESWLRGEKGPTSNERWQGGSPLY